MSTSPYEMSFSTGGLFLTESVKLAECFRESMDWNVVREQVQAHNVLQVRTLSTAQRVLREVISRLKRLSSGEVDLLLLGDCAEQRALLWVAVMPSLASLPQKCSVNAI